MGKLTIWTKELPGYTIPIEEPLRPFALNYLAASGMFDKLVFDCKDGRRVEIAGADLLKMADVVCVKDQVQRERE